MSNCTVIEELFSDLNNFKKVVTKNTVRDIKVEIEEVN